MNEELSIQSTSGQLAPDLEEVRSWRRCVQFRPFSFDPALTSCFQLLRIEYQTREALSKIRSSKNSRSSINRLPPEVLALIPYSFDFDRFCMHVVRATHVCRYWRNTFIAFTPLWSRLSAHMMHKDTIAAFIDRSGAAPLEVTFNWRWQAKTSGRLVPHSTRICKMHFINFPFDCIAEISNKFDQPLPMLREVVIQLMDCDLRFMSPPPFERPFLTGATNLVLLNLLSLQWWSGTLLHFVIPTLTHLKITIHNSRAASIGELLEFFRNSPQLEDIHIQGVIVHDTAEKGSAFPDQFEPVDLPHLHNIYLGWNKSRSQCTLLAHIKYPPTCSVSLKFIQPKWIHEPPQPPEDVFPKSWEAFSLPNISSVTIRIIREKWNAEFEVIVKEPGGASISVFFLDHQGRWPTPWCDFSDTQTRHNYDDGVLLAAISFVRRLPLHWIKEFALEGLRADGMFYPELFEIPPDLIKLICWDLPLLTTLSLTNTCVSELFTILAPPPPPAPMYIANCFEGGGTSKSNLPCSMLKVLEMRHPKWEPKKHWPEAIALAKARWSQGVPFQKVFIHLSVMPEIMPEEMSLYVVEFLVGSDDNA